MNENINIRQALKEARENADLSQNEAGKKSGISQSLIGKYEKNQRLPSILACIKLANTYNTTLNEMFTPEIGGGGG